MKNSYKLKYNVIEKKNAKGLSKAFTEKEIQAYEKELRTSLVGASTAGGANSISGWISKILHAIQGLNRNK